MKYIDYICATIAISAIAIFVAVIYNCPSSAEVGRVEVAR